ncbi:MULTISPECIES: hypothetical protein [unclassified Crossiella]|uniref:hypothetical protein n=1 Tax=unclassified Crossiella TaxID=2620835 RepID=UPI001FFE90B4|nr:MULTISPECIES: hypothetical protein [unclassified Crossiella]MCK2241224.1 hypothetical protein [Crossiella sp. S99.2]MCK2253632.1 hypothetical protein [Crossiella sp. S99.1]
MLAALRAKVSSIRDHVARVVWHLVHLVCTVAAIVQRCLRWFAAVPLVVVLTRWAKFVGKCCAPTVLDVLSWLRHRALWATGGLIKCSLFALLRTGWRTLGDTKRGLVWSWARLAPYLVAYTDFAKVVANAVKEGEAKREKRLRAQWRRAAWRRTATAVAMAFMIMAAVLTAAQFYGWLAYLIGAILVAVPFAVIGAVLRRRGEQEQAETDRAMGQPFPIADAHTRKEAADCVTRAVQTEGIELRGTEEAVRQPWGWQVPVILQRGTPDALIDKLAALETTLDLPAGGLLATPASDRRARVVLRLALRDPFAQMPEAPQYEPGSLSIVDSHVIAQRMDGTDLGLCLFGAHVVVIGVPGAGKSVTLRTLADVVSACRDAQAWDLAPSGDGLDVLGGAIARRARTREGIERALADALDYAEARPRLFGQLGMGDSWQVSPERPAVVLFIDEYPALSDEAKELCVRLLRAGRKARIGVVFAASEATSDTLGRAIADTLPTKIMLPCRNQDIRLVLGTNRVGEGWRPDRLNPESGEASEDAGKCYIYAAKAREPMISKIRLLPRDRAHRNGAQRATAGLPRLDADTIAEARKNRAQRGGSTPPTAVDEQAVVDVLGVFGIREEMWTKDILPGLVARDQRYQGWTGRTLATVLRPLKISAGQVRINGTNLNGYYLADITEKWEKYQRDSTSEPP